MSPIALALARAIEAAREDAVEFVRFVYDVDGGAAATCNGPHAEWQRAVTEHDKVVLVGAVGLGRSLQLSRWRLAWELGRNPNLRAAIVSSGEGHPRRILSGLRADIEHNPRLRMVFPELRASTDQPLWTTDAIRVVRSEKSNDASVVVLGVNAVQAAGSRLDLLILDDLQGLVSTLSPTTRDKTWDWVRAQLLTRSTSQGLRVWCLANAWHSQDVAHRLAALPGWHELRCPAVDGQGHLTVPEVSSHKQLAQKEAELGPVYADAMLRCIVPKHSRGLVSMAAIEKCLILGRGLDFVDRRNPADGPVYAGVDLGDGRANSDLSCIFAFAVLPTGARRILRIESGQWDAVELQAHLRRFYAMFACTFAVEINRDDLFGQILGSSLPVHRHRTTASNKHAPVDGVMGIALELEGGQWIIPAKSDGTPANPEAQAWINELITYSPHSHMGDRLAASWFARSLARVAFDVLEHHEALEASEEALLRNYGIEPDPIQKALRSGGYVDINLDALRWGHH